MKYLFHERAVYCWFRKPLLIMRLTAIILLIGFLHAGARGFTQTVNLSVSNMPLDQVCQEIEKQTGCYFVYAKDLNDKSHLISVEVKHATIEEALQKVFEKLPFTWQVIDNVVVVNTIHQGIKKNSSLSEPKFMEINGRVTNTLGEPLMNASVVCQKSKKGIETNANGEFKLKGVNSDDILLVSYTGYKSVSVNLSSRTSYTIIMEIAENELDKAVIQAYGKTTQRLTTSNIAVISAEEIERQPVMNPLLALQGKVAGLDVNQTSGYASAPIKVELRGRSGISSNFPSDPLYIIDGVPLTIVDVSGQSRYQNGSVGFFQAGPTGPAKGQNPLFNMNPTDIESIEVLKDADATAIYGSRGANGVVLISTKKGKIGKTKFDMHIQEGVTNVTRFWKLLNTKEYLVVRREALKNDGFLIDPIGDYDINGTWDTTKYTDWQRALYGKTGKTIDVQGSLAGGDARTTFRIGMGYNHTENITTVSGADQRASFSLNVTHHSLNQRLTISSSSSYSNTTSNMISLPGAGITMAPDAPEIFDSSGNLNYAGWGGSKKNTAAMRAYPFSTLKKPFTAKTNFLNSNLSVNYRLFGGLSFATSFGYNIVQANVVQQTPIASQNPLVNPTGSISIGNSSNKNWIIEPQLTYDLPFRDGRLAILIGASVSQAITDGISMSGSGYTSDLLLQSISSAPVTSSNENYGEYRYAGIFGRITYSLKSKYILNLNARRDGSSRFGPGKQFGDFASLGLTWIVSEEKWIKNFLPSYISFIKLRGSYGTTGSDAVGDYAYLSRYSSNNTFVYNGVSPLVPIQNPNPNYQWQVNKKLEGSINLGFLKDQITVQAAYYRNRCGNQLISFPTAVVSGFSNVTANSPALVQNSGWEFIASAKLIESKNIGFSVNFNGSFNKNKLVAYPNFNLSPYVGTLSVGQPLNIVPVLHYTGVDPQTGNYTFYDKNHNGMVNYYPGHIPDDTYFVNLSPKFFGGVGIGFRYKSFKLDLFFNIKDQVGANALAYTSPGGVNNNQPIRVLNRWQKPGDIKPVARFSTYYLDNTASFSSASDGIYTIASFVRLSNLSISYNLPYSLTKKIGMNDCNIFLHSNNVFVITTYKGIDPETQNYGGIPPTRTIVGGININL